MDDHIPPKKILITSNSSILLRVLKLNLGILRLSNGGHVELVEYLPDMPFDKDHWTDNNPVELIVTALSCAGQNFDSLLSQISMISRVWQIPLLVISDYWPADMTPNQFTMRLDIPFDLDALHRKIESALMEQLTGQTP